MQPELLRWADRFPELGTGPLPTAPYTSSDHFARERDRIFSCHWLFACREDDVPEPGSYFVRDLPGIPASIVVTARGRPPHPGVSQCLPPPR